MIIKIIVAIIFHIIRIHIVVIGIDYCVPACGKRTFFRLFSMVSSCEEVIISASSVSFCCSLQKPVLPTGQIRRLRQAIRPQRKVHFHIKIYLPTYRTQKLCRLLMKTLQLICRYRQANCRRAYLSDR